MGLSSNPRGFYVLSLYEDFDNDGIEADTLKASVCVDYQKKIIK